MSEIDTSAEAVEQRCELLRLQGMALATHFPRSPRFVGMFDGDIALLRALAAERDDERLRADTNAGAHEAAMRLVRLVEANRDRLAAERDVLREALRKVRDIGLGPDRGSAQWQVSCAQQIARVALAQKEPGA
jgi:hypothetical protein